jgi:hypothetical protein
MVRSTLHSDEGFFMEISASVAAEIAGGDQLTLVDIARQFKVAPSTGLRWILRGLPDGQGGRRAYALNFAPLGGQC